MTLQPRPEHRLATSRIPQNGKYANMAWPVRQTLRFACRAAKLEKSALTRAIRQQPFRCSNLCLASLSFSRLGLVFDDMVHEPQERKKQRTVTAQTQPKSQISSVLGPQIANPQKRGQSCEEECSLPSNREFATMVALLRGGRCIARQPHPIAAASSLPDEQASID